MHVGRLGGWTDCSAPGQVEITARRMATSPRVLLRTSSLRRRIIMVARALRPTQTSAPDIGVAGDASITCYAANSAGGTTYAVTGDTCDAFPATSGSFARTTSTFYARVVNATSGLYTVRTTGTDMILNPCGSSMRSTHPCGMSQFMSYTFELAVAGCARAARPLCRTSARMSFPRRSRLALGSLMAMCAQWPAARMRQSRASSSAIRAIGTTR